MDLNFIAPINQTGYGVAGTYFTTELVRQGHRVALFPMGHMLALPQHHAALQQAEAYQDAFRTDVPSVRLAQQFDLALHVGRGPRVGFPIFELDWFTVREKQHLQQQDLLLVCSAWSREVLRDNGITVPIAVVPLGVDREVFDVRLAQQAPAQRDTIFMNIGKIEPRKGQDVLVRAFHAAFQPSDAVHLVLLGHNPYLGPDFLSAWTKEFVTSGPMAARIQVIDRPVSTHKGVAELIAAADVGVFPARAEGWNLELPEFMAMGKPVIATNVTGHTAYLTADNATCINLTARVQAKPDTDHMGRWWDFDEASFEQLVEALRAAHRAKQAAGRMPVNQAGLATAEQLSWGNAAQRMVDALSSEGKA